MTKVTISQTTNSQSQHKIGSFLVTELQRHRFMAALNIAKRMRSQGEGDPEDAVRAIELLRGGGYFDDAWSMLEANDNLDYDCQVNAYYDGAAELRQVIDGDQHHNYLLAMRGNC